MTPEKLDFLLRGSEVKRFHAVKTLQEETVGHHSHLVAMLCMELDFNGIDPYNLVRAALYHDLPECETGDIPGHTKKEFPGIDIVEGTLLSSHDLFIPLNTQENRILKLADLLAGLIFCIRERELGSKLLKVVEQRYRESVKSMGPFSEIEERVVKAII